MRTLTQDQARRLALGAQGFSGQRPGGRIDVRHFRKVLATVGVLQLDTVNVLVRAQYLPLFSRLGPYDRAALDRWTTASGELFEYWGHMASLLPTPLYPRFRWRMRAHADEPWGSVRRILEEGPPKRRSVAARAGPPEEITAASTAAIATPPTTGLISEAILVTLSYPASPASSP